MIELLLLAMIWGGSFLFMRIAVPELGPIPMAAARVVIGALVLVPMAWGRVDWSVARARWKGFLLLGLTNTAIPFCLLALATVHLTAGASALLNATAPLFTLLWGAALFGGALRLNEVVGILLGFAGVALATADKIGLRGEGSAVFSVCAALGAPAFYGFSANLTRSRFSGIPALTSAALSQIFAALVLAPFGWSAIGVTLSPRAWGSVLALGVFCTGVAYVIYFRLISRFGPARAILVTFLVPVFAMLWGFLFLDEPLTGRMILGAGIVLAGSAVTMGLRAFGKSSLQAGRLP